MCQKGANRNRNQWTYIEWAHPPKKIPYLIAAKQLEMDENVKRARLITHFLALNLCLEQSCSFCQTPNEWTQIEHNICSHRAAWSPLCWWPCYSINSLFIRPLENFPIYLLSDLSLDYTVRNIVFQRWHSKLISAKLAYQLTSVVKAQSRWYWQC